MQFTSSMYSNATTSTRINSSMYIRTTFVCSTLHPVLEYPFNKGLLTQNATWCQNRGCICISPVRRTYGGIHIPATIILWTELFPKKRREKMQGEILQSSSSTSTVVFPHFYKNYKIPLNTAYSYKNYSVSTCNPATPRYSTYRINSSTRILQEILQLQGSSHVILCRSVQGIFQQLFPVHPSILHGRIQL